MLGPWEVTEHRTLAQFTCRIVILGHIDVLGADLRCLCHLTSHRFHSTAAGAAERWCGEGQDRFAEVVVPHEYRSFATLHDQDMTQQVLHFHPWLVECHDDGDPLRDPFEELGESHARGRIQPACRFIQHHRQRPPCQLRAHRRNPTLTLRQRAKKLLHIRRGVHQARPRDERVPRTQRFLLNAPASGERQSLRHSILPTHPLFLRHVPYNGTKLPRCNHLPVDGDTSCFRLHAAAEHPQECCLARATGAHDAEQLTCPDSTSQVFRVRIAETRPHQLYGAFLELRC
mmetsp:Transcript_23963/g.59723  ORF Transcript_23963/g.59723 Transcript_23963/m.59723 type:complete len:287 (+) Transcript_23963:1441-2301(+)